MPGEFLILSSTKKLAQDLIDALQKETEAAVKPLATTHSVIEIDGAQLAAILSANRESLIRNNMLEEGNSRDEAETAINTLLLIAERVGDVKLNMAANQQQSQAGLQLQVNLDGE
jgi:sarcosine oxidase gamma subunit